MLLLQFIGNPLASYLLKAVYHRPIKEAYIGISLLNNLASSQNHSDNKFQQIGSDLQSGNLFQVQRGFCALQQYRPRRQQSSSATSAASSRNSNPLLAAVNQLRQALQSGNLSARQSDCATAQQDVQQIAQQQGAGGGVGQDADSAITPPQALPSPRGTRKRTGTSGHISPAG